MILFSLVSVLLKSLVQDLKCPRGLQEADFLELLRSAFPQLAADKPFNVFKSDRSRRLQRLRVKTLTPEEIYRAMKSTGVEKSVLYIRLKVNTAVKVQILQFTSIMSDVVSSCVLCVSFMILYFKLDRD